MDFDSVNEIEMFIENLNNPKKQIIARNLMLDTNYQIKSFTVTRTRELFIKDLKNTEVSNWCIDQVRVDLQQNEIQVKFFFTFVF
jgi:hypothetical protein